ncbi:hypothetical protein IWQ60_009436 [Tieghemiomyces parasiticus]|uniref:Vacuolar protein sorting-associated protein 8 central domain-containing protein n=1 Tax=Tieghemiomyces parasiticus TaxID=78921 RepID=A0A9W7ZTS7_9FUNG|nr:hypothetical protein IWQ60_009436 [Tieghemiomyces parasiticus]
MASPATTPPEFAEGLAAPLPWEPRGQGAAGITYGLRPVAAIAAEHRQVVIPEADLPTAPSVRLTQACLVLQGLLDELAVHLRTTQAIPASVPSESRSAAASDAGSVLSEVSLPLHTPKPPTYRTARLLADRIAEELAVYRRFLDADLSLDHILAESSSSGEEGDVVDDGPTGLALRLTGRPSSVASAAGRRSSFAVSISSSVPESPSIPSLDRLDLTSTVTPGARLNQSTATINDNDSDGSWAITAQPTGDLAAQMNQGFDRVNGAPLEDSASTDPRYADHWYILRDAARLPSAYRATYGVYGGFGHPTALAAAHVLLVGTTFGLILVYAPGPEPALRRVLAGDDLEREAGHHGAVTALQISPDRQYVLAGFADGHLAQWDLETGARRFVIWPPGPAPVTHLAFVGVGHAHFVVGDAAGRLELGTLTRGLWGPVVDTRPTQLPWEGPHTAMAALPYGPNPHATDKLGLVAVLDATALTVMQIKSRERIVARVPIPSAAALMGQETASGGCLAWFPAITPDADPQLAYAVGTRLTVLALRLRPRRGDAPRGLVCEAVLVTDLPSTIHILHWFDARVLLAWTTPGTLNAVHAPYGHYGRTVVARFPAWHPPLAGLCCHKGRLYGLDGDAVRTVALLTWSERLVRLLDDGRYIDAIRAATRLLTTVPDPAAASSSQPLAVTSADGEPRLLPELELTIGLPAGAAEARAVLRERLHGLIQASLNFAFRAHTPADHDLLGLARASIDACLATGHVADLAYLFDDVYRVYRTGHQALVFVEALEPYILVDRIQPRSTVPPELVHDLLDTYPPRGWLPRIAPYLLHLDPAASFDIHRVLQVCRAERFDDVMAYTWTRAVYDFVRPLNEMLARLATLWHQSGGVRDDAGSTSPAAEFQVSASTSPSPTSSFHHNPLSPHLGVARVAEEARALHTRILRYVYETLAGRAYPHANPWPEPVATRARQDILTYLCLPVIPRDNDASDRGDERFSLDPTHWPLSRALLDPDLPALALLVAVDPTATVLFFGDLLALASLANITLAPPSTGISTLRKADGRLPARQAVVDALLHLTNYALEASGFLSWDPPAATLFASPRTAFKYYTTNHADVPLDLTSWCHLLNVVELLYATVARHYAQLYPLVYLTDARIEFIIWFLLAPPLAALYHQQTTGGQALAEDSVLYSLANLPASPAVGNGHSARPTDDDGPRDGGTTAARELGLQALVGMRLPLRVDNFLAGCERAGFYRVVELLNRALGRLDGVAHSYLDDPDPVRRREVFSCLHEFLRLDDYRADLDAEITVDADGVMFGIWCRPSDADDPTGTSPSTLDSAPGEGRTHTPNQGTSPCPAWASAILPDPASPDAFAGRSSFSSSSMASVPAPSLHDDPVASAHWRAQFRSLRWFALTHLADLTSLDSRQAMELLQRFWSVLPEADCLQRPALCDPDLPAGAPEAYRAAGCLITSVRQSLRGWANALGFPHLLALHWLEDHPRARYLYLRTLLEGGPDEEDREGTEGGVMPSDGAGWYHRFITLPILAQAPQRPPTRHRAIFTAHPHDVEPADKVGLGVDTPSGPEIPLLFPTGDPLVFPATAWQTWYALTAGFTDAEATRTVVRQWVERVANGVPVWSVPAALVEAYAAALCEFDRSATFPFLDGHYAVLKITRRCYESADERDDEPEGAPSSADTQPGGALAVGNIDLEAVLQVCESAGVDDAVLWIWQRQGHFSRALNRLCALGREVYADLLAVLMTASSEDNSETEALVRLDGVIRAAVRVCTEASQRDAEDRAAQPRKVNASTNAERQQLPPLPATTRSALEDLWYTLLQLLIGTSQRLLSTPESVAHDRALAATGDHLQRALAALLHAAPSVSLARLLRRLLRPEGAEAGDRRPPATAMVVAATYGQFRDVLGTILDTYRCEEQLLALAGDLLHQDLFVWVIQYVRQRQRGWAAESSRCACCSRALFANSNRSGFMAADQMTKALETFFERHTRPWLDPRVLSRISHSSHTASNATIGSTATVQADGAGGLPASDGIRARLMRDAALRPTLGVLGLDQKPGPDAVRLLDRIMTQYRKRNSAPARTASSVFPHLLDHPSTIRAEGSKEKAGVAAAAVEATQPQFTFPTLETSDALLVNHIASPRPGGSRSAAEVTGGLWASKHEVDGPMQERTDQTSKADSSAAPTSAEPVDTAVAVFRCGHAYHMNCLPTTAARCTQC